MVLINLNVSYSQYIRFVFLFLLLQTRFVFFQIIFGRDDVESGDGGDIGVISGGGRFLH
jgi:hypothetical protein